MLKKIGCIAVAILLAFCFIGCDSGELEPGDLAVSGLKAITFEGGVQLTWDPASNVQSYDVYRRTVGEKTDAESKLIASVNAETLAANNGYTVYDVVSFTNQLVDKRKYQYTVVANGRNSVNGRAIVNVGDGAETFQESVFAKVTVTANIPAMGTKLAAPVVTFERIPLIAQTTPLGTGNENLFVTFERVPGAEYSIAYGGSDKEAPIVYSSATGTGTVAASTTTRYLEKYGTFSIPGTAIASDFLSDGSYGKRIEVRAQRADNYYLPSDAVEKSLVDDSPVYVGTPPTLSAQLSTTAGFTNADSYLDTYVILTWTAPVTDKAPKLYKADATSATSIFSSWKEITTAPEEIPLTAGTTKSFRLIDEDVVNGKGYAYMLVSTSYNDGKAAPAANTFIAITNPTNNMNTFKTGATPAISAFSNTSIIRGADGKLTSVKVIWSPTGDDLTNATYKLYRARIETVEKTPEITITTLANIAKVGTGTTDDWGTMIATLDMSNAATRQTNIEGTTVFFHDTGIASLDTRVHYAYKLVVDRKFGTETVTKNDGGSYRIINVEPFVTFVRVGVTAAAASSGSGTTFIPANSLDSTAFSTQLTLSLTPTLGYCEDLKGADFSANFFKKGNADTAFVQATGTPTVTGGNITADNTFVTVFTPSYDAGAAAGTSGNVTYRASTNFKGKAIHNVAADVTVSDNRPSFSTAANSLRLDTQTNNNFVLYVTGQRLAGGVKVNVDYRIGGGDWSTKAPVTLSILSAQTTSPFLPLRAGTINLTVPGTGNIIIRISDSLGNEATYNGYIAP